MKKGVKLVLTYIGFWGAYFVSALLVGIPVAVVRSVLSLTANICTSYNEACAEFERITSQIRRNG